MIWIILVLMCGLPFSSLFIHIGNIWVSHGVFFQLAVLCSFSYSIFKNSPKPMHERVSNKPLGCLLLWLGVITAIYWNLSIVNDNNYSFILFMPFFNFLCFVLFYRAITQYLTEKDIDRVLRYFSYVIGIMGVYCLLQWLDLDQFHKHFNEGGTHYKDSIVGTIGNSTHIAGWLAICLPVIYYAQTKFSTISILIVWAVIIRTGSASSLFVAIIITIFYNYFYSIRFKHERFLFGILGLLGIITIYLKGFDWITSMFLNPSGRFEYWQSIYPLFKDNAVFGGGLGKILSFGKHWKHAHNEYYQIAIEGGLPALGIVVWGIVEYLQRFKRLERSKLSVCLCSIFLGFILLSLVNFTCHLYMLGVVGMFAYSSLFCLKGEI